MRIGKAVFLAFWPFLLVAGLVVCTPAQRETARTLAPVLERIACVVLRAATTDGTVDQICATADELAPLVRTLLESRAAAGDALALEGDASTSRVSLAVALQPIAELPAPKRRVARRHCALWLPVASSTDGSADAAKDIEAGSGDSAAPR